MYKKRSLDRRQGERRQKQIPVAIDRRSGQDRRSGVDRRKNKKV